MEETRRCIGRDTILSSGPDEGRAFCEFTSGWLWWRHGDTAVTTFAASGTGVCWQDTQDSQSTALQEQGLWVVDILLVLPSVMYYNSFVYSLFSQSVSSSWCGAQFVDFSLEIASSSRVSVWNLFSCVWGALSDERSESLYGWQSVSQNVLVSSPFCGRLTRYCFLFKSFGLEFVVLCLWGALSDERPESLYSWQSVRLGVEPILWTFDQILLPFQEFRSGICCPVSGGALSDERSDSESLYDWRSVRMSWYRAHFADVWPDIASFWRVWVWNLLSCLCGAPSLTRGQSHFTPDSQYAVMFPVRYEPNPYIRFR
jgi:hypothetical protein